MAYNKIIYGSNVLIDLTADTLDAAHLLTGYSGHGADGEAVQGTCTFDADTSDATGGEEDILAGKTDYKGGKKITGTMPNKGAVAGTIAAKAGVYTIPKGYHDGTGTVQISGTEQDKLIPGNVKTGVTLLGVLGEYSGAAISAQSKAATPAQTQQTIQPDAGYDYLSSVVIAAIPYQETANASGGTTVTIG